MNELQVFDNPEFGSIRTLMIDDEPWAVGKDIATALGYTDSFGALKKHVDAEDKQNCQNSSFGTPRGMTIINESGMYSLILSSKLPSAKAFKRWVTSEVLPSLRKTGKYCKPTDNCYVEEEPPRTELPGYALTPIDYLNAARTIAMSRRDQLPYVIDLLKKAGFSVAELSKTVNVPVNCYTEQQRSEYAQRFWDALDDLRRKGLSYIEIDGILGKAKGTSERYYAKRSRPRPDMAVALLERIEMYLTE